MIEVINREILIPREEYNIGTCYDDNTETRHFHLKRVTSGGVDLAALTFNLDIQYANGSTDAASLVKEVTDKDINLVLTINNSMLQVPGTVLIQIRALEEDGTCKWTSYKSAFFVEDHINTPGHYQGDLTQLEQYEGEWGKVRDNVNQLNLRMDQIVRISEESPATEVKEEVADARVGADNVVYGSLGTAIRKQFENVYEKIEDDTGDWTAAVAAEAAARAAADTALQDNINAEASSRASAVSSEANSRATADAGLQTQINQLIAPSGEAPSAAEVQNARIGADGITYDTLGDAIRANDTAAINELKCHNSFDILSEASRDDYTHNDITYHWNSDGSCTITGTASGDSFYTLLGASSELPASILLGKTYYVKTSSTNAYILVQVYKNDTVKNSYRFYSDGIFAVSSDATSVAIRLAVLEGTTVNETVNPVILNNQSNEMLLSSIFDNRSKCLNLEKPDAVAVRIPSNSDLDNYVNAGQYIVNTAAVARSISHIPEQAIGQLIVEHLTTDSSFNTPTLIQIYISKTPNVYIRYSSGSSFAGATWNKIADNNDIAPLNYAVLENINNKSALSSGDDLNDFTTVGQWRVPTTAIGRSLKNKPRDFNTTGHLLIMNTHNTNHVYQIIMSNGGTNIWARHIMINEEIYDRWINLATADDGDYSWAKTGFLIHDPIEENQDMIDVVADILGITITNIGQWSDLDENNERIIPAEKIYDLWDDLQSKYPEYIDSGETIGYSKDIDGSNYAPIKAYYIHPRKSYVNWSGSTINITYQDLPTIYLSAGTHGGESTPTWTLFEIFRRAFLTGTIYSSFLTGLQFRVIPCLDIWSYDHKKRYLAAAYDANGDPKPEALDGDGEILEIYDANRQCICSDMDNPSYINLQLQSFASEAAALTSYLQTHDFGAVDGDSFIDMHNCSYSLGYLSTDNSDIEHFFKIMVDELNKDWMANTTFANGDPVDYYASYTADHTRQRGKILTQSSTPKSFAWFFEKAYDSYASNILEVQGYDPAGSSYAYAKAHDMTYRWFRTIFEKIKNL